MDPVSITASAIAIGGLIKGVLQTGKTLRGVDESALALLNELSDLEFVMDHVRHVFEQVQGQEAVDSLSASSLTHFLARARCHLDELEQFVQYDLISARSTENRPKFNRGSWLRNRDRIQRLKDQLRDVRMNIFTTLSVLGYSTGHVLQISLNQMRSELEVIRQAPQTVPPSSTLQDEKSPSRFSTKPMPSLLEDTASLSTKDELSPTTAPEITLVVGSPLPSARQPQALGHDTRPRHRVPASTTYHAFEVRLVRAAAAKCDYQCTCRCHSQGRFQSPAAIERMVGSLFLGYSNIPLISRGCNDRFCQRESSCTFSAVYMFPTWLCQKQLRIFVDKPELLLRISQVRPSNALVFLYAKKNYVPGLKRLLSSGQASVLDVNEFGQNSLWVAVAFGALDVVQFLMQISADARQTTRTGWSALHEAWKRQLMFKDSPMQRFFKDRRDLKIFGFSNLHQGVLGLNGKNLETAIQYWQGQDIDIRDATGHTPLHWAARRNDQKAIALLLAQGADMNIRLPNKLTPLSLATNLCEAFNHCDLNGFDCRMAYTLGNNLLHVVMGRRGLRRLKCPRCLENIIRAGVDVNGKNKYGLTPLHLACRHSLPDVVELLLKHGANMEAQTFSGRTPLHMTVIHRNIQMARLLLSHGANAHVITHNGGNILHYAALFANKALLETLSNWGLSAYLLRWKDRQGDTPMDLMRRRTGRPWVRSFLDMTQQWPGPNVTSKKQPCLVCHKKAWQKAWNALVESLAEGPAPHPSMLISDTKAKTRSPRTPKAKTIQTLHSPIWAHLSEAAMDAIPFVHPSMGSLTAAFYVLLTWWMVCWLRERKVRQSPSVLNRVY